MMKTERLTTFSGNLITDTFIPTLTESNERNSTRSEAMATFANGALAVVLCSMIALAGVLAWCGYDLHKVMGNRMTYWQSTKSVVLHWVSPERGEEYLLYTVEQNRRDSLGR